MDIVELGKVFMNCVRTTLEDRYHTSLETHDAYSCLEADGSVIRIGLSNFSANVQDMTTNTVVHYEFLKCLGEIGTYVKITKTEDGNLNVVHSRCVRDGVDTFAIMSQSAALTNISGELLPDEVISWPYPFFCITLEETLNMLKRKGSFDCIITDPEYAVEVKAEDIIKTIDNLAKISEDKLNVEPSR